MLDCDILVYATPVYEKAVTALLKRFMERSMTVLYMGKAGPIARNEVKKNKTGVVLVSCGTPFPANIIQGITRYPLNVLGMFCKAFRSESVKKIKVPGTGSKDQISEKNIKKIFNLASNLANS